MNTTGNAPPARGPLEGMRVLDLSRFVAGPYCAMMLGDMGADVVKIERPGKGETARGLEPGVDGESFYCFAVHRNKKGLTLDYGSDEGRALFHAMVAKADVVVENFRPGVMEAIGCGWETLRALNPRLVMARISGFGQDGPLAHRQCFDAVAQAMSGLMHMTGQPDRPPMLTGSTIIDYTTGMYAAMGVLAALNARHVTGEGQLVDVALLDSAISLMLSAIPDRAVGGLPLERNGNRDRFSAPGNTFHTGDDRWVLLTVADEKMFENLARAMGRPDLPRDPRFADRVSRVAHVEAIETEVTAWTRSLTADEVVIALEKAGVPCAKVASIDEMIANPQLRHRGQIVEVPHPSGARIPIQGVTMRLSQTPLSIRRALPHVGEHSDEVLHEWLGLAAADIGALRQRQVV
ncbi:CaiB/BaiF CoA transferase family protein [Chelatococcus reniformis]|uniref:CoA transferase n=1 Tax=Chelatococcus reniformis TaxID=1494448 RepID=A0A916XHJ5_9HYPH|nr:CoA transferase [Chelatococcus reniformis]GGC72603.1 CoA transferase [Chelatococcus reniformis]